MANVLSVGRHRVDPTEASAAAFEVHHDWPMVLGRGSRGGGRVSGSLQEICVRALPRSAAARAFSAFRVGDEFEPGRSGDRAAALARLESRFASSRSANTDGLSTL